VRSTAAPAAGTGLVAGSPASSPRGLPRWLRYGAVAAALVLAAGIGYGAATRSSQDEQLAGQVAVLETAAETAMRLESQPDTERIALVATAAAPGAAGTLLYSPTSGELVMVADGLAPLAEGEEYGCWVETGGTTSRIGRMYPGGSLQAWAGPVDGLGDLPPDAVFGVSLVPAGGGPAEPVLTSGATGHGTRTLDARLRPAAGRWE
jgi:hypothetical protein